MTISAELASVLLDTLGLAGAIEWHVRRYQKSTGVPCELTFMKGFSTLFILVPVCRCFCFTGDFSFGSRWCMSIRNGKTVARFFGMRVWRIGE